MLQRAKSKIPKDLLTQKNIQFDFRSVPVLLKSADEQRWKKQKGSILKEYLGRERN